MRSPLFLVLALWLFTCPLAGQVRTASSLLSAAIYEEEVSGNLEKAIELYLDILKKYPDDRPVSAKTLYHLGLVNEKLGKQKADEYYTRLINTYPDQKELVELARSKLARKERIANGTNKEAERLFKEAREQFNRWQYDLAIKGFDSVVKLVPGSLLSQDARYWTGMTWFKSGDNIKALTAFQSLVTDFPESAIIPVTEIMITQVKQAQAEKRRLTSYEDSGDGIITDQANNVIYRKIATIAGKNDVVTHPFQINSIAPNGRYVITDNRVIPFDAGESYPLFDQPGFNSQSFSVLSPDATKVAYFTENALEMVPVSPETGCPSGIARKLLDEKYQDGFETFINWSPDGDKLVFLRNENDSVGNLWTIGVNDGKLIRITDSPEKKWSPSFTNDGKFILYGTMDLTRRSDPNKVWMSPAEGGLAKVIIDSIAYSLTGLQWSPDHNWIVYRIMAPNWKRYLYHVEDKKTKEIITPKEVGTFVSWSPDGEKMFFYQPSYEPRSMIKVVSVYGGPAVELGSQVTIEGRPNWSPDNQMIVATGKNAAGRNVFWMLHLNNQDPKEIAGISSMVNLPFSSISPDHTKLLTSAYNTSGKSFDLSVAPVSWKEAAISAPLKVIFRDPQRQATNCSWSPDGSKIALSSQGDIWICKTEGGDPVQFTNTPETENFPDWSPDGSMIAMYVRSDSGSRLDIRNANDGRLIRSIEDYGCYSWSPDGKEIAIATSEKLSGISVQTGEVRTIRDIKALNIIAFYNLSWSPDGKNIVIFAYKDVDGFGNHIYLFPSDGSKITELATDDEGQKISPCWSPDSRWISYTSTGIRKVRLEGTLWEADTEEFLGKMLK